MNRFLDPAVLARISDLELLARTVVSGFINGLHRSPAFGLSTDFAEHRAYMPGDDIRRLDWRVYGRTDRLYVKEFEADTNANLAILLDLSRSMRYTSGVVTKLDYARYLAASLAWLSRHQRDRIGLVTFDADIRDYIPCSARHLDPVLHAIDQAESGGAGALAGPLERVAEALPRRSIIVLLSDLYEEPAVAGRAFGMLKARGHDVIVLHLLDPAELTFPFADAAPFEDLESGERIHVVPEKQREGYRALLEAHLAALRDRCAAAGVDYALMDTSRPLDYALAAYLARRQALSRVR